MSKISQNNKLPLTMLIFNATFHCLKEETISQTYITVNLILQCIILLNLSP